MLADSWRLPSRYPEADARLKRKESRRARGRHPPCRTDPVVPAIYGGWPYYALAPFPDTLSDRVGHRWVAVELHSRPAQDLPESGHRLPRDAAAAALCGCVQHIVA